MNKFLIARGIVQEVTRCLPGATITAPPRERPVVTMLSERERLDTFRMSKEVHQRKTWPIRGRFLVSERNDSDSPDPYYDEDLAEGFALKYGRA